MKIFLTYNKHHSWQLLYKLMRERLNQFIEPKFTMAQFSTVKAQGPKENNSVLKGRMDVYVEMRFRKGEWYLRDRLRAEPRKACPVRLFLVFLRNHLPLWIWWRGECGLARFCVLLWGKEDLVFLRFSWERRIGLFMVCFREGKKRSGKLGGRREERRKRKGEPETGHLQIASQEMRQTCCFSTLCTASFWVCTCAVLLPWLPPSSPSHSFTDWSPTAYCASWSSP